MNTLLFLALLALAIWLLYLGRALLAWVLPLALGLLIWYLRTGEVTAGLWVSTFTFAVLTVGLLVPPVRRSLVTSPLMPALAPLFPEIDEEERAALETGTVGWDGELFRGDPDWTKLPELEPSGFAAGSTSTGNDEGNDEQLAPFAGLTYLIEAARRLITTANEKGESTVVPNAIAEIYLAAEARRVDELGRGGTVKAVLSPLGNLGAADAANRSTGVFARAELLAHPFARAERETIAGGDAKAFDAAICGHLGHYASNFTRAALLGWSHGRLARSPLEGPAERYFEHFTRMSAAFAVLADATTVGLGGALENDQRLKARLADAFAWLYLGSAALKRWVDAGQIEQDEPLARWAIEHALFRVQDSLFDLLDNLPGRRTAWMLRWKLFPCYARFRAPGDALEKRVAQRLRESEPG